MLDESPLDLGPEWRAYDEEERRARSRVGGGLSMLRPGMGVYTFIRPDQRGRKLAALHARVLGGDWRARRLAQLLHTLERWCGRLGWPRAACETAAAVARRLHGRHPLADPERLASAALLYASAAHGLEPPEGLEGRHLLRLLRDVAPPRRDRRQTVARIVARTAAQLGLPASVESLAMLVYHAYRIPLYQTASKVAAAAAVYVAARLRGHRVSYAAAARAAGASDYTVSRAVKLARMTVRYVIRAGPLTIPAAEWVGRGPLPTPSEVASAYGVARHVAEVHVAEGGPITVEIEAVDDG